MIYALSVCSCGRSFEPTQRRRDKCRACASQDQDWQICERCDRPTLQPLEMRGGELQCPRCLAREPEPTPEEIEAVCARIRAGWTAEEEIEALRGEREEIEGEQGPS